MLVFSTEHFLDPLKGLRPLWHNLMVTLFRGSKWDKWIVITVSKIDQNLCASFQKTDHKERKCAVSEKSLLKTPVFKTLLIFFRVSVKGIRSHSQAVSPDRVRRLCWKFTHNHHLLLGWVRTQPLILPFHLLSPNHHPVMQTSHESPSAVLWKTRVLIRPRWAQSYVLIPQHLRRSKAQGFCPVFSVSLKSLKIMLIPPCLPHSCLIPEACVCILASDFLTLSLDDTFLAAS